VWSAEGCRGMSTDIMGYRGISWKKWKMWGDDEDVGPGMGRWCLDTTLFPFSFNFLLANISPHLHTPTALVK